MEKQRSKNKPPKPSFGEAEATILARALQFNQSRYATTIAQDQELLAQLRQFDAAGPLEGSARRTKMAIQVRLGEKEILQNLFSMLNSQFGAAQGNPLKRAANGDVDGPQRNKALRT